MLCDGEHQQEALPTAKIVVPDGSVVLLAGCVQNVNLDLFPIQNHFLPVAVCLGGLIVLHKLGMKKKASHL